MDFKETMKNLQKVTESLSKLNSVDSQHWKTISNMQEMFDDHFWKNIIQLTNHSQDSKQKESNNHMVTNNFAQNIDMYQTENKIFVSCEVPGFDQRTLEISVSNSRNLTIKGKFRKHPNLSYLVKKERNDENFVKKIKLPHPVSTRGIKRSYIAGILELQFIKIRV